MKLGVVMGSYTDLKGLLPFSPLPFQKFIHLKFVHKKLQSRKLQRFQVQIIIVLVYHKI